VGCRGPWILLGGLVAALWSPAAAAACASLTGVAELAVQLGRAEQAFVEMDPGSFRTQREAARQTYTCLAEVVTPSTAVAYHQLEALDAFLFRDTVGATRAFQAVLQANPRYVLPPGIAPEGHPLWQLVEDARALPASAARTLEPPTGLTLRIDGRPGTQVRDGIPAVMQLTTPTDEVAWTGYLRVGDPDPDWRDVAAAPAEPEPPPPPDDAPRLLVDLPLETPVEEPDLAQEQPDAILQEPQPLDLPPEPVAPTASRLHAGLGAGAGVLAVATGGLYALAWSQKSRYQDMDNPDISDRQDLEALRDRNRLVSMGAVGTGILAVGLGLGAVVTWRF